MDDREGQQGRAIGSVKAAIHKYGGKINLQVPNSMQKPQKGVADSEVRLTFTDTETYQNSEKKRFITLAFVLTCRKGVPRHQNFI